MKAASRIELDQLVEQSVDGKLMPRSVITFARNPKTSLHSEFTWDKNKALEKNLITEARQLLAEYTVVKMHGETAIKTRHFVSLTSDRYNGGGFRVISTVLDDEAMTQQLLTDALLELTSFQAKYKRLSQLASVFEAIDVVQAQHKPVTKRRSVETRV